MWISDKIYAEDLEHQIAVSFTCPDCGTDTSNLAYLLKVPYKRDFLLDHVEFNEQDTIAMETILKNKLLLDVMRAWISSERGEYFWAKDRVVLDNEIEWKLNCPHCGALQEWTQKKSFFKKIEQIDDCYLPMIDWRWAAISPEAPAWVEHIRTTLPELFDPFDKLSVYGMNALLLKARADKKNNRYLAESWPTGSFMLIDTAQAWRLVVPGLLIELTQDLMGIYSPLRELYLLPLREALNLTEDEGAWGYSVNINGQPSKAFAITLLSGVDADNFSRVIRTVVVPQN